GGGAGLFGGAGHAAGTGREGPREAPGRGVEVRVRAGSGAGQGQAERGETRDGDILQRERGADCGGAIGRFFHAADAGGTGPDVGDDRSSQEGGKIKWGTGGNRRGRYWGGG